MVQWWESPARGKGKKDEREEILAKRAKILTQWCGTLDVPSVREHMIRQWMSTSKVGKWYNVRGASKTLSEDLSIKSVIDRWEKAWGLGTGGRGVKKDQHFLWELRYWEYWQRQSKGKRHIYINRNQRVMKACSLIWTNWHCQLHHHYSC